MIATNYANHPFMYYLGSHVIVGTNLNNIVRERSLDPDVVIPRRRWPRGQRELRAFLARGGEYAREALPVRDVHFNNIPALSRSRFDAGHPPLPDADARRRTKRASRSSGAGDSFRILHEEPGRARASREDRGRPKGWIGW